MSEKVTIKVERKELHLPTIALRGLVVFPNNLLHFEVGRDKSIAAVEWAVRNKSEVFLIAQKDMKAEDPKAEEMYQYGVVAEIKQVMRVSDDLVRILVEGKFRAKRTELDTEGSFLLASVRPAPVRPIKAEEETEAEALLRNVKTSFDAVLSMNPRISKDVVFAVTSNNDPAFLCEYVLDHCKCDLCRIGTHQKLRQEDSSLFKSFSHRIQCRDQVFIDDLQRCLFL